MAPSKPNHIAIYGPKGHLLIDKSELQAWLDRGYVRESEMAATLPVTDDETSAEDVKKPRKRKVKQDAGLS